jgi:sec-independent protein translocase protein TatA
MNDIQNFLAIGWPQGFDWLWILLIALLVFGGSRLPQLARSLGKSMSEFKKGLKEASEAKDEVEKDITKLTDDADREINDSGEENSGKRD